MLSQAFSSLFLQLAAQRVAMDSVLELWLLLSEDYIADDGRGNSNGSRGFDPSRVPSIPVSTAALDCLMGCLSSHSICPLPTWVLAFQTLTLICNQRSVDMPNSAATNMSSQILSNQVLNDVLLKFLTGTWATSSDTTDNQVGPTATRAFQDFLQRLSVRLPTEMIHSWSHQLLQVLLSLTSPNGAMTLGLGPLDAQCCLLEVLLGKVWTTVEPSQALRLAEQVSVLTLRDTATPERLLCRHTTDLSKGATRLLDYHRINRPPTTTVNSGATMRGNGAAKDNDATHELLMSQLLGLVRVVSRCPVKRPRSQRSSSEEGAGAGDAAQDSSLTDTTKLQQAQGRALSDEEKTGAQPPGKIKSCNHFINVAHPTLVKKSRSVGDLILGSEHIMSNILQALSSCSETPHMPLATIASSIPADNSDVLTDMEPVSVSFGLFHLVHSLNRHCSNLNLILKPFYDFLSSRQPACQLSEPLVVLCKGMLDCEPSIKAFLEMGGVEVICRRLVHMSQRAISTSPSLVSGMMQYLGAAKIKAWKESENLDGMHNFSPISNVVSSNSKVNALSVLKQPAAPHRRARSPAWSYHFYPDEAWIDITFQLPCCIVLRDIYVLPHLGSLATCPSAISIEVSRDGVRTTPLGAPLSCSGMAQVRIRMQRPEVVTMVTLRLHRPRDSNTIGLAQIKLMGYLAFSDGNISWAVEENNMSVDWLRLLHHCLTQCNETVTSTVATAAASTSDLLLTCVALLTSPAAQTYSSSIEHVLLSLGLHATEMGLQLIRHILGSPVQPQQHTEAGYPSGLKRSSVVSESAVDILYQLGVHQDSSTMARLGEMCSWLQTVANQATSSLQQNVPNVSDPSPELIHCIATVLWRSKQLSPGEALLAVVPVELLKQLFEWSLKLQGLCKQAVDAVICSLCYINQRYLGYLLEWCGIRSTATSRTDDSKQGDSQAPVTDDAKASHVGWSANLQRPVLTEAHLQLLGMACQSEVALESLMASRLLTSLTKAITAFCVQHTVLTWEATENSTAVDSALVTELRNHDEFRDIWSQYQAGLIWHLSPEQAAHVLHFLGETAKETLVKDWLGNAENHTFWLALLYFLCNTQELLTSEQKNQLEIEGILFFKQASNCHVDNQLRLATSICNVITDLGCCGRTVLSGFMRRLLLQVLLEEERVQLCIQGALGVHTPALHRPPGLVKLGHPRCGAGHRQRMVSYNLSTRLGHIVDVLTGFEDIPAPLLPEKETAPTTPSNETSADPLATLSHSGQVAQDKRQEKMALPPRPLSRCGYYSKDLALVKSYHLKHEALPGQKLPHELSLGQLLTVLQQRQLGQGCVELKLCPDSEVDAESLPDMVFTDVNMVQSVLQVFASVGGLSLLAQHLPLIYSDTTRPLLVSEQPKDGTPTGHDWVTVDSEEFYDDIYDTMATPHAQRESKNTSALTIPSVPPHSLMAFGVFLRLPSYAEVLLKQRHKAQCLLRLVLGVADDGDGGHILHSPLASTLPTLPFTVLGTLFSSSPLSTDDGVLLRQKALELGVLHIVLSCLSVLSHHPPRKSPAEQQSIIVTTSSAASLLTAAANSGKADGKSDDRGQFWAKGTGFGTGSTISSWDAEQAQIRQKMEEEHVTCLIEVLAEFINPGGIVPDDFTKDTYVETTTYRLPANFVDFLSDSCLVPALCSYLRNDSVLDMSRHVPLYKSILELLRAVAVTPPLLPLLLPLDKCVSIVELLSKMRSCVDTYASRLKGSKGSGREGEDSEGLALLIPNIQNTTTLVQQATHRLQLTDQQLCGGGGAPTVLERLSMEEKYINVMRDLQFDTCQIVKEEGGKYKLAMPYHYDTNVKSTTSSSSPARARRLAQEAVTLSTSLPLSYNSSVFVRCDEDRLDVMKVLITGPADTPYANGCFEFDVYFPQDYPNSPPLVNLETTGNKSVRFNPNLYNDGKVCLSVLNTWHGRPEEKWNSQTSSFLQVLVSIQSLILVPEPYFNEPGYERSRGTSSGTASCREYDSNIQQASVKWAMLEMIRNPPPCFKEVIHNHFYMKKDEIMLQVQTWLSEMESYANDKRSGRTVALSLVSLKRNYGQLFEELKKLKPPSSGEDEEEEEVEADQEEAAASTSKGAVFNLPGATASNTVTDEPLISDSLPIDAECLDMANHVESQVAYVISSTDDSSTSDSYTSQEEQKDGVFHNIYHDG